MFLHPRFPASSLFRSFRLFSTARIIDKDFKYFLLKAKVQQMYREALKEANSFPDPCLRDEMTQFMKAEFQVFRKRQMDAGSVDYHLALIRKKLNHIKELKQRVS